METLKLKGKYSFRLTHKDGQVEEWIVNNLIVSAGKAQLALLAGTVATPFTYIAVGSSNTAVAAGQTTLQAEISTNGLSRVSATVSRITTSVANDTLQLTYAFTVSGSSTIEEIGIFNANSSGVMLGRALTGSKSVINGDQFTVTYTVQFS